MLPINMEPIHPELVAAEYAKVMAENERAAREALAARNRADGIREPKIGDKLYVSCGNGVLRRSRGGLHFHPTAPKREVVVVEDSEDLVKRQRAGEAIVSKHGAEEILADPSLVVHSARGSTEDASTPSEREERLASEVQRLQAELAAARRAAGPDPGDGTSARLKAAQKTREAREARDSEEFGGPPGSGK